VNLKIKNISRLIQGKIYENVLLFLLGNFIINTAVFAENNCFIAKENGQLIKQEGSCSIQHSPCSTFKIAISLMGYNEGILMDETHPEFPFKEGYVDSFGPFQMDAWKQPQNPTTWVKNSCIWYSQIITQKLDLEKFTKYVKEFQYGNQDVTGDPGKNNGLTNAWLSSSLQISPQEQIEFLEKAVTLKLPVSQKAVNLTSTIFFNETMTNGWKLYAKTGTGFKHNSDGTLDFDHQIGWFVGWITKNERTIFFAQYIEDNEKMDTLASSRAKALAKERLANDVTKEIE
jgi:beta-lactamase class D